MRKCRSAVCVSVAGILLLAACGADNDGGASSSVGNDEGTASAVGGVRKKPHWRSQVGAGGTAGAGGTSAAGSAGSGGLGGAAGSADAGIAGAGGTSTGGAGQGGSAGTDAGASGGAQSGAGGAATGGAAGASSGGSAGTGGQGGSSAAVDSVTVHLAPAPSVSGSQRVNFALPLKPGRLTDSNAIRVLRNGLELPTARRALATHPDGSLRSVQLQVDVDAGTGTDLQLRVGEQATAGTLSLASVASTLSPSDGTQGPRVWALLPAAWMSDSRVAGPQIPRASVAGTALAAWDEKCDYAQYDTDLFLTLQSDGAVWLYDRGTVAYRGYVRSGDMVPLNSAYREASIYFNGIVGTGSNTRIGVPGKSSDLKYHYAQNLAIHYLLTGDERFREAAENIAIRVHDLMGDPGYAGGSDFWTERNAGFALLAYTWAAAVSDDRKALFSSWADQAVDAFVSVQETYPIGYTSTTSRCFAHSAAAHDEPFGYFGCSPWMSAILADGLDAYAWENPGAKASKARTSIVKLGRILAQNGRDGGGKPYYWMGVGTDQDEVDPYDEHWGESAYVVAMAWHYGGRTESALKLAADQLVAGFRTNGELPHMRSFNWQCRSAVGTSWFLY